MGHRATASWAEESLGRSGRHFIAPRSELHPWRTGQTADDAPIASDGIAGAGGWRKGCVGTAPRGQGQVIRVTLGPRLSFWSGLGRRRCRRGEEEDTVPRVANAWGPDGSGSWWGRRACGREYVLGWLAGPVARSHELGWPTRDVGLACGPSRPSRLRGLLPFFSFFCFIFLLLCLNSNLIRI